MKIYNNLIELEEKESNIQNKILDYDDSLDPYNIEMNAKTQNKNQDIYQNKYNQEEQNYKKFQKEDENCINSFMKKVNKDRFSYKCINEKEKEKNNHNVRIIDKEDEDNYKMIEDFIKKDGINENKFKDENIFVRKNLKINYVKLYYKFNRVSMVLDYQLIKK